TRFFELLPLLLALLIPALGMRQYVSERRGGMYEVLTTLPVGETEILVGKTIALWLATILMLLPSLLFAVTVALLGRLDPGPAVTGYLGALLLAAAYSGVSMFAATLSRSVIVALLVAVALTMVLASLETIVPIVPPALVPLLRILSVTYHVGLFSRGVIDALSVSYLISVAVGALALARHTARVRR
ncbi:MAG: ABC transporter permease, partial [Spirochaetaceae bacterium]